MKNLKTLVVAGLIALVLGGAWFFMSVSAKNKEVTLKNHIEAQQEVCKAYYQNLWTTISQKAQVAEQYKEGFEKIYTSIMEGRYGDEKGGSLMRWIQESNPNFDVSLYKDLSNAIEGKRNGYFMEQKKLIDLNREHTNLLQVWPSSMFVGDRPVIEIIIIKGEKTNKVYATGEENDVDVFKK